MQSTTVDCCLPAVWPLSHVVGSRETLTRSANEWKWTSIKSKWSLFFGGKGKPNAYLFCRKRSGICPHLLIHFFVEVKFPNVNSSSCSSPTLGIELRASDILDKVTSTELYLQIFFSGAVLFWRGFVSWPAWSWVCDPPASDAWVAGCRSLLPGPATKWTLIYA